MGTIGQTSTGSNQDFAYILDMLIMRKDTLSVAGQRFTKLTAYVECGETVDARGLIYAADGVDGLPGTMLASSTVQISAGGPKWVDFEFVDLDEAETGDYWYGVHFGNNDLAFNAVGRSGATSCYKVDTYSDGSPSPYGSGGSSLTHDICCYLTYEAAAASTVFLPHIMCHHTIPPFIGGH